MVDPTSDLGQDVSEDDAPRCGTCEEPILSATDHRVVTWVEADEVRSVHFCDEECRERWNAR